MAAWRLGWLDRAEVRTWDLRVSMLAHRERADPDITLVFLDQSSLDWARTENSLSWPWPREVYTPIISSAAAGGARSVAFDVLYTEPSGYGVEDDQALASAIADARMFVGTVFLGDARSKIGSATNWPPDIPGPRLQADGLGALPAEMRKRFEAQRALFPIPEVATNAAMLANVFSNPDPDGIYRRIRLFATFDGRVIPSLGLAAYIAAHPGCRLDVTPGQLRVGGATVPLDREGRAILRYRGPTQTHRTVTAATVVRAAIQGDDAEAVARRTEWFKGRHVLFGFSAPGLYDLRSSPISGVYPGVEIHATVLDNLLADDFMRDAPAWLTALLALALAVLGAILTRSCHRAWQAATAFIALLPLPFAAGFAAYAWGVWLPIMAPLAGLGPALVAGLVLNYATEGRQKRFIKGAFKQYLSPAVIEELVEHPERLKLGGETRELSIYFSDIQGFTGISETMSPEQLTAFLNEYLTEMTDIIYSEGGTIDKYEGDAIIAFWNAPLPQEDHPTRAVRAAIRCQARLRELRPAYRERVGRDVLVRIGLHTGPVVIGNMGSNQRFNYTFLGDAGNLASRLEGVNKQFGTYALISAATRERLAPDLAAREIGRVAVVGRKEPVVVYEPMTAEDRSVREPLLARFDEALRSFYAGRFREAATVFGELAAGDPVSRIYATRCEALVAAPPAGWDGVIRLTEK